MQEEMKTLLAVLECKAFGMSIVAAFLPLYMRDTSFLIEIGAFHFVELAKKNYNVLQKGVENVA